MAVTKALAISISGLGTSSAGIFGIHKWLEPKTVEEKLLQDKYSLLKTTEGDTTWETIKNNNTDETKKKKLQEFIKKYNSDSSTSETEIEVQKLKTACEALLKEKPLSENVSLAKEYCAKKDEAK